ncbi:MAG: IgGFc-binding protein [Bradymonadaceae bacterium]
MDKALSLFIPAHMMGAGGFLVLCMLVACQDDVDRGSNRDDATHNIRPEPGLDSGDRLDTGDFEVGVAVDSGEDSQVGECVPGVRACKDPVTFHTCNAEGTGYQGEQSCPDEMICEVGGCTTICDLGGKGPSYIGCEYWTVDLDQYPDPTSNPSADEIPHAVVISNPGDHLATLTFESRAVGVTINIADPTVPPGEARAFVMPRLDVSGTGITQNAIHIRSSMPVIAHQFNPFHNENVYSNDASLLLPVSALGKEYFVMNWPTQVLPCVNPQFCFPSQHAYVTIVATAPGDTSVLVNSRANIAAGDGINEFPPGIARNFVLRQGDVLNLEAHGSLGSPENDLTGTFVAGDQPIAVFAGHEQAVIGDNSEQGTCCADHLEQQLFPLESWGQHYVATFSPGRGIKKDHWRILAGEDNVTITTNPPQPGANNVVLQRGEFVKFYSDQSFEVNGTGKILVGQFLVSQEQTSEVTGDPAFILSVPVERFRDDYYLLTPTGYSSDYVVIIRAVGESVTLDGVVVPHESFAPVGSGAYEISTQSVQPGLHILKGEEVFGIIAYGFNRAVSYGYPGGLDLVGDDPDGL